MSGEVKAPRATHEGGGELHVTSLSKVRRREWHGLGLCTNATATLRHVPAGEEQRGEGVTR